MAQNPYRLRWPRETGWVGGSGLVIGLSHYLGKQQTPLTPQDIAQLSLSRVPAFDRIATRHYSPPAQRASDWTLRSAALLPLVLLADPQIRDHAGRVGILLGEVFLADVALTNLTKVTANRIRPFVYNAAAPMSEKVKVDARRSFFSGHSSVAAAMCVASATIWTDYHPDSRWKPAVWAGALALPLATGFLRIKGGKHFPTDVLTGLAVGAATGYLIPKFHRVK